MAFIKKSTGVKEVCLTVDDGKVVTLRVGKCWNSPTVTCLCKRCAAAYYRLRDRYVIRMDPYQNVYDRCDYCNVRSGVDYAIFEYNSDGVA